MKNFTDKLEATAEKYAEILLNADPQVNDMKAISEKAAELAHSWHDNKRLRESYYNSQQSEPVTSQPMISKEDEDEWKELKEAANKL